MSAVDALVVMDWAAEQVIAKAACASDANRFDTARQLREARAAVAELIEALTTTSGNLHSLRAASPGVVIYDSWIDAVDAALARATGEGA